ncbi:MAG: hypothetical protein IPP58_07465 [Holophagaceae bacterium]|uniref:Alpha-2-macroglobulin domain-containing protein n=1 Tax=Candidatus Geothrix skivensis TaxID=2954439 RepID=A0A9D7XHP8_9BACT|nr:hypothetical protein [Candidatus Geothrix skivensis]
MAAGRDGRASVDLVLPDNLTAWRATVIAITGDTKVGWAAPPSHRPNPLQVALTCLITLSVGRRPGHRPGAQPLRPAHSREDQAGGPERPLRRCARRHLQPAGPGSIASPCRCSRTRRGSSPSPPAWKAVASRMPSDRRSPCRTSWCPPPFGFSCLDGGSQTFTLPVPPSAKGDALMVLTPVGNLEHLAAPSLPYLIGYPYGCVEQTLSSFVPNLLVADLVKQGAMPDLDWKKLTDLDRNIRDGVFRMATSSPTAAGEAACAQRLRHGAEPHTTGYAIQSLATMKRLGYAVDEGVYRRGRMAAMNLFQQVARQADQGGRVAGSKSPDPAGDAAFCSWPWPRPGSHRRAHRQLRRQGAGRKWPALTSTPWSRWPPPRAKHPGLRPWPSAWSSGPRGEGRPGPLRAAARPGGATTQAYIVPTVMALQALCLASGPSRP